MAGVKVVTDSSSDLPAELAERHDISVVPLSIRFGEEEFVDRRDLTPAEFWARCAQSPVLPETSAPSPGAFEQVFRAAAEAGADGVICVNISAKLSATSQSAQAAAQAVADLIPVRVVDSRSATLGLGMTVLEASRLAAEGKTLDEVVAGAENAIERTRVFGTLDTLENLKKGGRIGGAQALLGSLLSIKPVIEVKDGAVEPGPKQRTRSRALAYLVDKVAAETGGIDQLGVIHGAAPDLNQFLDMLSAHFPREKIVVGDIGPVVGAHTGPRTIAVAYQVS
ncbi:MAG: DegV family protein [Acidimicrobiales bacterium]|nr:DegV family protein [Actinomycetota bacterium]